MSQSDVIAIIKDAVYTTISAAAPMLVVAMVVGLVISIFQATTQINEQTLSFVPKIVAVLLSIVLFGGHIFGTVQSFVVRLFESITGYLH